MVAFLKHEALKIILIKDITPLTLLLLLRELDETSERTVVMSKTGRKMTNNQSSGLMPSTGTN